MTANQYNSMTTPISGAGFPQSLPDGATTTPFQLTTNATISATQLDRVSSTTLTNVPNLTATVVAGGTYIFRAKLLGVATTNGGSKVGLGGTCTATAVTFFAQNFNTVTTNAAGTGVALATAYIGTTTVFTDIVIEGTITVALGGTLTVQFAQNASHADTSSVYVGSAFTVTRVS